MEEESSLDENRQENVSEVEQSGADTLDTPQSDATNKKGEKKIKRQIVKDIVLVLQGVNNIIDFGKTIAVVLAALGVAGFAIWKSESVELEITPKELDLLIGEIDTLCAKVNAKNDSLYVVKWTSDNERVVMVNPDGVVCGVSAGTANIKAEIHVKRKRYITKYCACSVKERPITKKARPLTGQARADSSIGQVSYFKGDKKDGKPHTNNGIMYYFSKEKIPGTECFAESGDYVSGQWRDGKIVKGDWYIKSIDSTVRIYAGQK